MTTLLTLPTDVRLLIFEEVLLEHPQLRIRMRSDCRFFHYADSKTRELIDPEIAKPQVQVLRTCKKINDECKDIILKKRTFSWDNNWYFLHTIYLEASHKMARVGSISNVELTFDSYSPHYYYQLEVLDYLYTLDCDSIARHWSNLKRIKVIISYRDDMKLDESGEIYGLLPKAIKDLESPPEQWRESGYYENGFIKMLAIIKETAGKDGILPDRIEREDDSWRRVERIMDFDFKWDDYSDSYHEKNWSVIYNILKACHTSFGGGELWSGGILCWKENVAQAHMNSIDDWRKHASRRIAGNNLPSRATQYVESSGGM
ncbi:hypothetical protein MFRU_005g04200 [Monilinia fructicola]|nr:hypothetical protein MFRU_005g04200 [Monilinia fructicola]